jgi:hypothetical protein
LGSSISIQPLLSTEQLHNLLLELHQEKLDLMVHSIGDLATSTVLDAVQSARQTVGEKFYPRVTIAHLALIKPADIQRMKKLDIIANFSPWWFGVEFNSVTEKLLGSDRYNNMYRVKTVMNSGATNFFQ